MVFFQTEEIGMASIQKNLFFYISSCEEEAKIDRPAKQAFWQSHPGPTELVHEHEHLASTVLSLAQQN